MVCGPTAQSPHYTNSRVDYLHLTKRFGTVASSQLPLHYLLALKTPWSPLQAISRFSHETLNASHQLLGRIVTLVLYLHAALYVNFYVQANLLGDKLKEIYVLCGIVGIIAFTAVGTTALSPVRKWSYRVFYITHVSLATAILPLLYFHVSHIRIYLYETAAIYTFNAALRALASKSLTGTVRLLPDSSLLEITIPLSSSAISPSYKQTWQPGQHAYISLQGHPLLRTFRCNPFTVASLPSTDDHLKFVARVLDGNTAKLASSIASGAAKASQRLTIEGPYGVATHGDELLQYDRVLFVAGGVGATFVVPLYRQLLNDLSPSKGSYRRQKVSFVWIARTKAEVEWAVPKDEIEKASFTERLRLCLTQEPDLGADVDGFAIGDDEGKPGDMEEGIELEERKQLLSNDGSSSVRSGAKSDLPIYASRPDLARLLEQTMGQGGSEKVAIVVCGPRALSQALRNEIGPWVKRGRKVWFWDESFSY